jgi:adenylate cyclase
LLSSRNEEDKISPTSAIVSLPKASLRWLRLRRQSNGSHVERRLAAILVADIVGYSTLMSADEVGTLRAVKACRTELIEPCISARGGRIVKTTGDGVLAEFPSAVDAVACAITLQQGIAIRNETAATAKRLTFRVGINVGDIIIDQNDIFGDGVNIAARLEKLSEPGGICISGAIREHIQDKLPLAFDDLGEQHVKNIPRPVHAFGITAHRIAATPTLSQTPPIPRKWNLWIPGAVMVLVLVGGGGSTWWVMSSMPGRDERPPSIVSPGSRHASIAILPFASSDSETGGDYFSDGLTEDIISALGRFRDLSVISRGAVFAYKGKSPRPEQVGRELSVGYVAEGSVRRSPDRIRVSISLTDTAHSSLLWSAKYDVEPKDIFAVQDQITRQISGALAVRLSRLELKASAAKPPSSLEAYDLVLRGRDLLTMLTRPNNAEARGLFERAIELDPSYSPSYVGLGRVNRFTAIQGWAPNPSEALEVAESLARKAIALDDLNPGAHALLGQVLVQFGDYDRALDELKRAIEINASDSESYSGLCAVLLWRGDTQGAISAGEILRQFQPDLSPPETFHLATAYVLADRGTDAIRVLQQSLDRNPAEPNTNIILAAAYAQTGRQVDAERQSTLVRQRFPWFSRDEFGSLLRDPTQREKLRLTLKQSGL